MHAAWLRTQSGCQCAPFLHQPVCPGWRPRKRSQRLSGSRCHLSVARGAPSLKCTRTGPPAHPPACPHCPPRAHAACSRCPRQRGPAGGRPQKEWARDAVWVREALGGGPAASTLLSCAQSMRIGCGPTRPLSVQAPCAEEWTRQGPCTCRRQWAPAKANCSSWRVPCSLPLGPGTIGARNNRRLDWEAKLADIERHKLSNGLNVRQCKHFCAVLIVRQPEIRGLALHGLLVCAGMCVEPQCGQGLPSTCKLAHQTPCSTIAWLLSCIWRPLCIHRGGRPCTHATLTFSEMRFDSRTRPSPPQVSHGVKIWPVPSQRGHVATCWNMPRGVRTALTTWPEPPHCGQVLAEVPFLTPDPVHVCECAAGCRWWAGCWRARPGACMHHQQEGMAG